jgi:hypothetical protein
MGHYHTLYISRVEKEVQACPLRVQPSQEHPIRICFDWFYFVASAKIGLQDDETVARRCQCIGASNRGKGKDDN